MGYSVVSEVLTIAFISYLSSQQIESAILYIRQMCLVQPCALAFLFLHCGELTSSSTLWPRCTHDWSRHLHGREPPCLMVHLKASKNFCNGITLYLRWNGVDLCPVVTMGEDLLAHGNSPSPLFQFQHGSSLHQQQLVIAVRSAPTDKDFNTSQ